MSGLSPTLRPKDKLSRHHNKQQADKTGLLFPSKARRILFILTTSLCKGFSILTITAPLAFSTHVPLPQTNNTHNEITPTVAQFYFTPLLANDSV